MSSAPIEIRSTGLVERRRNPGARLRTIWVCSLGQELLKNHRVLLNVTSRKPRRDSYDLITAHQRPVSGILGSSSTLNRQADIGLEVYRGEYECKDWKCLEAELRGLRQIPDLFACIRFRSRCASRDDFGDGLRVLLSPTWPTSLQMSWRS